MQDNAVRWFAGRYGDPASETAVYVDRSRQRPEWATATTQEFRSLDECALFTRAGRARAEPDPTDVPRALRDHEIAKQVAPRDKRSPQPHAPADDRPASAGRHRREARRR